MYRVVQTSARLPPMATTQDGASARERLLAAAIEYVSQHGVGEISLRGLAAALGTSHRMLIYHFGSREALLIEVIRTVEEQQRMALAAILEDADEPPAEIMRRMWARVADPALWPNERLFFEVYAQALQGSPHALPLLDGIVDAWVEPLAALVAPGLPHGAARGRRGPRAPARPARHGRPPRGRCGHGALHRRDRAGRSRVGRPNMFRF